MGNARVRDAKKQTAPQTSTHVEWRVVRLDKRKALRMGFIPFQPDLFADTPASTDWTRELKRPRCQEYWNPAKPGRIRRVFPFALVGTQTKPATTPTLPEPKLAAGAPRSRRKAAGHHPHPKS